jgi:hypothetical protein
MPLTADLRSRVLADGGAEEGSGAAPSPPTARVPVVLVAPSGHRTWTWGRSRLAIAISALALVVGVALIASAGRRWSWTGFSGQDTLWSWLSLLAQPVALAVLPLELLTRDWSRRPWKMAAVLAAVLLTVTGFGGYVLGWSWTGLSGVELWDWLHVFLFPVVLVFLPSWAAQGAVLGPSGRALVAVGVVCFVTVVVGGYGFGWSWTGFAGNTFRDWLDLLIAPFLVPAACKFVHSRQLALARPVPSRR